jgi:hypothetical protein
VQNKCENYEKCPSASGWCLNKQPSADCVQFLLTHTTSRPKVYYECDHRACEHGRNTHCDGMCNATLDIRHAKNFEMDRHGNFREKSAIAYE